MKRSAYGLLIALVTFVVGVVGTMYFVYGEVPSIEEMFGTFAVLWVLYLVPAIVPSLPIWFFGRRKAKWMSWELSVLVLPYLVWVTVGVTNIKPKSIANLEEAALIGCLVPIALLIRALVGQKVDRGVVASGILVALCMGAFLIYWFVPMLPE